MIDNDGEFFRSRVNGKNLKLYHDNTGIFAHFKISNWVFIKNYNLRGSSNVELLLVILTSSINILVINLLVLLAIYLQIDIYPRFIYKLILFLNWI